MLKTQTSVKELIISVKLRKRNIYKVELYEGTSMREYEKGVFIITHARRSVNSYNRPSGSAL